MSWRSRVPAYSINVHTLQAIQKDCLSMLKRRLFAAMLGFISELPEDDDCIEEDGCCTVPSISSLSMGIPDGGC